MDNSKPRIWYEYLKGDVAAKARTNEMLQELVIAVVHAAADYDMYATGKVEAGSQDHESSYWYLRNILNRLGIPPQAIIEVINECYPDDPRDTLTTCATKNARI